MTAKLVPAERAAVDKDHNVKTDLVLGVLNARSTRNKTDRIRDVISEYDLDVLSPISS